MHVGGTLVPKCLKQFTAKAVPTNLKTFAQREVNEKTKNESKSYFVLPLECCVSYPLCGYKLSLMAVIVSS